MRLSARNPLPILGLVLAVAVASSGPPAQAEIAGPPKIIDGDTIEVQGAAIRLYGIDAPELGQTCRIGKHSYDCGKVARTALLDLTAGVPVTCELAPPDPATGTGSSSGTGLSSGTGSGTGAAEGRPGRCTAEGYDLSEGMTYTGWALALRRVSERYTAFEDGARAAGRGLWKGEFVAPWAWRAGRRLSQTGAD